MKPARVHRLVPPNIYVHAVGRTHPSGPIPQSLSSTVLKAGPTSPPKCPPLMSSKHHLTEVQVRLWARPGPASTVHKHGTDVSIPKKKLKE